MTDIEQYNAGLEPPFKEICELLYTELLQLENSESKVWHGHPVWFINGNPVVGYSIQKPGVRLMFWSGADFQVPDLIAGTGKFKDASVFYNSKEEVDTRKLQTWLRKAVEIQWDYKNIVKRKGRLERI